MDNSPIFRQIKKTELKALLDLYKFLFSKADGSVSSEKLQTTWNEIMKQKGLYYFVLELDGKLISTCTLAIIPNLTRGARSYGIIENVVTHIDFRKRGFGTLLLHKTLEVAWEHDCYKVMLLTGHKDQETLHFYEQAGFISGEKTGFIVRPPTP
jgi:N-acetylglutamate synthase-like GNAT family acetyltransferase